MVVDLISGSILNEKEGNDNLEFLLDYDIQLPTGIYLVLLETIYGTETRKLIIE